MKVPEMSDTWYLNFDYNLASSTSNKKKEEIMKSVFPGTLHSLL